MQNKVSAVKCRTRLTSLQTLQHCISCVHKSRTYSVWSAFLPPDPTAGKTLVLTCTKSINRISCVAIFFSRGVVIDWCGYCLKDQIQELVGGLVDVVLDYEHLIVLLSHCSNRVLVLTLLTDSPEVCGSNLDLSVPPRFPDISHFSMSS